MVNNLYPNLPGHLVQFEDGGLSARTDDTTVTSGESILIIGTAVDGLVNEPIAVDIDTIANVFGSEVNERGFSNGSTLVRAAKQAKKNGYSDIRCMRVGAVQAECEIKKVTKSEEEQKSITEVLGVISGNNAVVDHVLTNGPILDDSLEMKIVTTNGNSVVGFQNLRTYSKKVNINAGLVSAGAVITATYSYKKISAKKTKDETLKETGGVFDSIVIADNVYQTIVGVSKDTVDQTKDQYGYPYVDPNKCPVKVTVKTSETATVGEELVLGTDFSWTEATKTIKILSTSTLAADDEITLEYVPYEITNATETITMEGTSQEFTLSQVPIEGSEKLVVGTKETSSGWSYKDDTKKIVVVDPAFFNISDQISISYKYSLNKETAENLIIRSKNGGAAYNSCKVEVKEITNDAGEVGRLVVLTKIDSKKYTKSEKAMEFSSFNLPTMEMLCMAINTAPLNNVFEAFTDAPMAATNDIPLAALNLTGGTDGIGLTNNKMFEVLSGKRDANGYLIEQGAYQMLENYSVDKIYLSCAYADSEQNVNPKSDFHRELCLLCAVLSYRTHPTHGLIDMTPNSNPTLKGVQEYFKRVSAYKNIFYMLDENGDVIYDDKGKPMDIGWYTSLGVGPEPIIVSDTLGTYYGSPALAYGGSVAALPAQSSPTNKPLIGVKGLKYNFSNTQMNTLVGNRMIVFKTKNQATTATSSAYIVDGITCGAPGCDYSRMSTVRVVSEVTDQIREVADPFIGEPNTQEQRNALAALISKRLSLLLTQGVIQSFKFEISATLEMVLLGECMINLVLVAPQDLRRINTIVSLRASR